METMAQFLRPRDAFMSRGFRHEVRHVHRLGETREVLVIGAYGPDERYFEARFTWGDPVDTLD